ncbi:MAG: M28 family peptidase [Niastella sp.]|nr:M28 family peptidase [Niastella sp.]
MKKLYFLLFLIGLQLTVAAQDSAFSRQWVDTLTSSYFFGRGYTRQGMQKAAGYISNAFMQYGLIPLAGDSYQQEFSFDVNTFPGDMDVTINNKKLVPGIDFIVFPESVGSHAKGKLQQADSVTFINRDDKIMVTLSDKLTWSVAKEVVPYTGIELNKKAITGEPASFKITIENKFVKDFTAANIAAMVKGTEQPDSFIFITAHYDHLGSMGGTTYFPGANDNASGIALLMNLAHYYASHPQRYSMGFICFAAEEAGLVGSKYFTEHPLVPLSQIRFLINTDLAGTGSEGITVVNATEFPKEFALMNEVNDKDHLLVKINPRGKAANSDHYYFTEKGVPSFFFYTQGGIGAYHDVFDIAATLPLNEQEDLFKLVTGFCNKLMHN